MQTTDLPLNKLRNFLEEDSPSINVLTLYEDYRTRERAMRTEAHLLDSLGSSIRLQFSFYRLKLLSSRFIMEMATRALRNADIVLFSISCGADLPLLVKAWFASELGHFERHQCGLVTLVETPTDAVQPPTNSQTSEGCRISSARLFLSAVARTGGLDFLCESPASPPVDHRKKKGQCKAKVQCSSLRQPRIKRHITLHEQHGSVHMELME